MSTPQFDSDFKHYSAGRDIECFKQIVRLLQQQRPLPPWACDCPLVNTWGRWNCRISFDWWLIYRCDMTANTITFEQTGSFRYLFE
ncbi:type II toxin-antitoxin system YafQ family toxin [Pseudomonas eucalypticola]|uniref:Type II toxin-antitoxin system YafQ family toxin n=1 Tax=Pseudomonas eucalypticola TaxID=2599595 RepID=A0A7D5H9I3_9PSED|nr:type II toxin-antitoxin system YafQ family toxin [Pseudomonas eucalypticola]